MKNLLFASLLLSVTLTACAQNTKEKKSEEKIETKQEKKNGNNTFN